MATVPNTKVYYTITRPGNEQQWAHQIEQAALCMGGTGIGFVLATH